MAEARTKSAAPAPGKVARGSVGQFDTSAASAPPQGYSPRLKKLYEDEIRNKLVEEFGYKNALAGSEDRQDRAEHGRRRSGERHQEGVERGRRTRAHRRPEAGHHPRPQGYLDLQGSREHAAWCQGDAARRPHVRVPGPADHDRVAARPGFPGPKPEEL